MATIDSDVEVVESLLGGSDLCFQFAGEVQVEEDGSRVDKPVGEAFVIVVVIGCQKSI